MFPAAAQAATDIDPAGIAARAAGADVVILGEIHDNPAHHAIQADAVRALRPGAVVFEMLEPAQALAVTPETRIDAGTLAAALGWEASGWPDFTMYYPIFTAAGRAAIHGGALPRDLVRRAMTEGAAAAFGPEAGRYGLELPLPAAEQAAREAEQAEAHCGALPPEMLPGMVTAQRLRDAALARAVVQAVTETGAPVVLIAGSGHARRDWGVPAALATAAPQLDVLALGMTELAPGEALPPAAAAPYDLRIATPPAEREDPCKAFR